MIDHIIVRYGELSTKGHNRSEFEKMLMRNIQRMLKEWPSVRVARTSGRTVIALNGTEPDPIMERLGRIFGISSYSAVVASTLNLSDIVQTAISYLDEFAKTHPQARTFKIEAKRSNKQFPLTAPEASREIGHQVLQARPNWVVDVHQPDIVVSIEIRETASYLFGEKVPGVAGFPMGMSGRVGLLLSGGIDSPLAGWFSMKRGLTVDAVHFQSYPFTSERALAKVETLAGQLADWGGKVRLHEISLTEIQSAIRQHCPESMRTIIMRRMMVRLATKLAEQEGWLALVTGDSVGQVASQTLEGLNVLDEVTTLPILRPLITSDKVDIINKAKFIGTYETSILPYEDCCSIFAPKSPRTRPTREQAREAEMNLPIDELITAALGERVSKRFVADWMS